MATANLFRVAAVVAALNLVSATSAECLTCGDATSLLQVATDFWPKELQMAVAASPPPSVNMLSVSQDQLNTIVTNKVGEALVADEQGQHMLSARPGQIVVPPTPDAPAAPGKVQWRPRIQGDQNVNFAVVASTDLCPPYQKDCNNGESPSARLGDICALPVYEMNGGRYCITQADAEKWGWCAEAVDSPVDLSAQGSIATAITTNMNDAALHLAMPSTQGLAEQMVQNAMAKASADVRATGLEVQSAEAERVMKIGNEENARLARAATDMKVQWMKDADDESVRLQKIANHKRDVDSGDSEEEVLRMKAKSTNLRDDEYDASTEEVKRTKLASTKLRDDEYDDAVDEINRERKMATVVRDADFKQSITEVMRERQTANMLRDKEAEFARAENERERATANKARDSSIQSSVVESHAEKQRADKYLDLAIKTATKEVERERMTATFERDRQFKDSKEETERSANAATAERDLAAARATRIRDCYASGAAWCEHIDKGTGDPTDDGEEEAE